MKEVNSSYEILWPNSPVAWKRELQFIEYAARISHRSEDKTSYEPDKSFIQRLVDLGHDSVLEFGNMIVEFITDRGISHELVRHRLCSFIQESTRYCDYEDKPIEFISPIFEPASRKGDWMVAMADAEAAYKEMRKLKVSPELARSVLPNSLATKIIVKANFREWRHIFQLRTSKKAHPDMVRLMLPLYNECLTYASEVFTWK